MSLTKAQMAEIVAFDLKRRTGLDFDGRRYGSITGAKAPQVTALWELCHGSVVFKGKEKPARKTLRYNYIVADRVRGNARPDVTVVHVAVRLNGAYQPVVKDVGRWHIKTGHLELRDIDFHGLGGWIVEWDKEDWAGKRPKRRAGDLAGRIVWSRWCDGGKWKFNQGLTFPWHETVNPDALKGTKYEWCQYSDSTPNRAGLVDWLMMYNQEPKIELLAKSGMYALICPAGIKALKDRRVRDWCMAHREEVIRASDDRGSIVDIVYAARHGVSVRAAQNRRRFVEEARRFIGGGPWRIDYDRLRKTLRKWHVGLDEYSRYLEYAHDAGLDLRNEGTLYPPTRGGRAAFMERLERLEADLARMKKNAKAKARRQLAKTMKLRAAEIAAFQESVERTKVLKDCGYAIVLAKSQDELLAEGKKMHNCVGMGMYGRGIVDGDKLIVMLKKPNGRGYESFCDIEIDRRTWLVKQCYLKRNESAPEEVRELARKIAAWLKAQHKRHQKRKMFLAPRRKAA